MIRDDDHRLVVKDAVRAPAPGVQNGHTVLDGQSAALLAGAFEALAAAAFVCDRLGNVKALTPAAEALVTSGCGLQLNSMRLKASRAAEARALDDAIRVAAAGRVKPGPPILKTCVVHGGKRHSVPLVLDVAELPAQQSDHGDAPRVLILARDARSDLRKAAIVRASYAFTSAETDVAIQLSNGRNAESIAAGRGVAVSTVRVQIKGILAKLGVNSQIELVARLNQL